MAQYAIARNEDIDEITDGRVPWRPLRHHFGITSFGVNAFTGKEVGDRLINEHDEADEHEELYVVTAGHARFEIAGETHDAPAGTYVFVEPGVVRTAFAEEAGTTLLAIGGQPGEAYQVHGYEVWAQLIPFHQAGDHEAVADRGKALVEANPQYATPAYNVACSEAQIGRVDDAVTHLRQAIALSEQFREYARDDSDFDAIRDDPRFQELIGG
jgi:hypothetical protein